MTAFAALLAVVVVVVLVVRFRSSRRFEPKHELVERQLTANSPENAISSWAISRDGKYLAYSDSLSNNLYLLAIDSGEIRELPLPAHYDPWDWFPDGNHLVMSGDDDNLWKLSTWDFSLRKLWGGRASAEALSLDGSHFAIVNDSREIWLMGADREEPHQILASDAGSLHEIAWSPTGQLIAYMRSPTRPKPDVTTVIHLTKIMNQRKLDAMMGVRFEPPEAAQDSKAPPAIERRQEHDIHCRIPLPRRNSHVCGYARDHRRRQELCRKT